jgi:hypothetical protein
MSWDIKIVERGWWPRAWFIKMFEPERILVIRESPYNAYCREEVESVDVSGIAVEVWNNQTPKIYNLQELVLLLESFEEGEDEVEVEAASWLESDPVLSQVLRRIGAWFTDYEIYD